MADQIEKFMVRLVNAGGMVDVDDDREEFFVAA